jgi:uncharacterized protein (UPF0332 family)
MYRKREWYYMPNATCCDLAFARIEKAARCLQSAENVFDSKSHGAIIGKFREKYIKTGVFSAEYSKTIGSAFDIRNESDYEDFYVITKEDASAQVENAREFLNAVKEYITRHIQQEQG